MDFSKGWERLRDPKGQTGRRPIMGRTAKLSARNTLRFVELLIVRLGVQKNARGWKRGRSSFSRVDQRESLRGLKAQESNGPDPS